MIKKIKTINNLGIFEKYSTDDNLKYFKKNNKLKNFKRFNLIYGGNGSGKTTLSKLFNAFQSGKLEESPKLKYTITCCDDNYSEQRPYNKDIRVFNQEYIAKNVNVVSGDIKSIFIIVGADNLELSNSIKKDEQNLGDREACLKEKKKEEKQEEKKKDDYFINVAKTIKDILNNNYNKTNAKKDFENLDAKKSLPVELKKQHISTLRQQVNETIPLLETATTVELEQIIKDSKDILKKTVKTVVINRLKDNPDISKWVEKGIELHKDKSGHCEFCNQLLPMDRISELLAYFNEADKSLKDNIDSLLNRIQTVIDSIKYLSILDKANLYDELQKNYGKEAGNIERHKGELLTKMAQLRQEIKDKKQSTTEALPLQTKINDVPFISSIKAANVFIEKCNNKTKDFSEAKETAKLALKNHHLSSISDAVKKLETEINKLGDKCKNISDGNPKNSNELSLEALDKQISENKKKIDNSQPACEEINKQLEIFLGRDELMFEVVDSGYTIERNGEPADGLSEGEKTAIAFVYFTIHLKDQDFDIKNGIIVIDDPVSSLDSNSMFMAFEFLKNSVKDAQQVFILTHNFAFLKFILGWMRYKNKKQKKDAECSYFMIKNSCKDERKVAILDNLDPWLEKYDTEYQYLFELLTDFKTDGTIGSVYHIPNIARKTLESFLLFMVPKHENMRQKLDRIDFDESKKKEIYEFTNSQSHYTSKGFDPLPVSKCEENVKHLLEMIETTTSRSLL